MTAARDPMWRNHAACVDTDPELFFPVAEAGKAYREQVDAAKAVCGGCPVRLDCLAFALSGLSHGIAGGATAEERRGLAQHLGIDVVAPTLPGLEPTSHAERRARADQARRMLAAGRRTRDVATACGVTERTVNRWAEGMTADPARQGVPA